MNPRHSRRGEKDKNINGHVCKAICKNSHDSNTVDTMLLKNVLSDMNQVMETREENVEMKDPSWQGGGGNTSTYWHDHIRK